MKACMTEPHQAMRISNGGELKHPVAAPRYIRTPSDKTMSQALRTDLSCGSLCAGQPWHHINAKQQAFEKAKGPETYF